MKNRQSKLIAAACFALVLTGCGSRDDDAAATEPEPRVDASGSMDFALALRSYRERDYVRALERFTELAENGDAKSQYYVGVLHADGMGTARNYDEAAKWYRKAADQNNPDALRALARLHVFGMTVERDIPKAIELYERAEQAYPPGEDRDAVTQQKQALQALLQEKESAPQ